jgi:hypothetical protein
VLRPKNLKKARFSRISLYILLRVPYDELRISREHGRAPAPLVDVR